MRDHVLLHLIQLFDDWRLPVPRLALLDKRLDHQASGLTVVLGHLLVHVSLDLLNLLQGVPHGLGELIATLLHTPLDIFGHPRGLLGCHRPPINERYHHATGRGHGEGEPLGSRSVFHFSYKLVSASLGWPVHLLLLALVLTALERAMDLSLS